MLCCRVRRRQEYRENHTAFHVEWRESGNDKSRGCATWCSCWIDRGKSGFTTSCPFPDQLRTSDILPRIQSHLVTFESQITLLHLNSKLVLAYSSQLSSYLAAEGAVHQTHI